MRIFVAGATGVIGSRAVDQLVAAGHDVTGIARTPEKAAQLRRVGATPAEVSLFDVDALRAAVAGHDAVVNLATHIPSVTQAMRTHAWDENTRIRVEGSRNLVDAALANGVRIFVQESIAFVYGDHGAEWIDAGHTPVATSPFTEPVAAAEANAARVTADGGRGVVLRFGMFQAVGSAHTDAIVGAARKGVLLDVGRDDGYAPSIDIDDAARAVVAAIDAPAGVYDVVDEPITRREMAHALAAAVGRRRLHRPPAAGAAASKAGPLGDSQRVSNRAFREATGWRPRVHDQGESLTRIIGAANVEPALRPIARLLLWLLAIPGLLLGIYAEFFPRAFYDDFPFGRAWVAHDGPFNEHLIRDFGAMNLALAAVTLVAIYYGSLAAARAAAIGWLVFSVPHAVYHFRHLSHYETADKIGNVVSLSFAVILAVAAIVVLWSPAPEDRATPYDGRGDRLPQSPDARLRDDDLRGDVGARGGDGVDQPRAGIS